MNLFYLDKNPIKCAEYHNDKHVVKMIVELAQMLSTAHRVLDGIPYYDLSKKGGKILRYKISYDKLDGLLYKATHIKHPTSKWVRQNNKTYIYTYKLFVALLDEYTYRFNKIHACVFLKKHLKQLPNNIEFGLFIQPPQVMSEEFMHEDSIEAYRNYYKLGKSHLVEWSKRDIPSWYNEYTQEEVDRIVGALPLSLYLDKLTSKELEVFELAKTDMSPIEIATQLNISIKTLKKHLTSIYSKLDCNRFKIQLERFKV